MAFWRLGDPTRRSSYDLADRITNRGFGYDAFGRITAVPASHAGGGPLYTSYYVNDMVRSQTQDGQTTGWLLDPTLQRQRASIPVGGRQEILHYADSSDSPAWTSTTENGVETGWSRSVEGIDGDLAALYDSQTGSELQLTNLHGDVVATASPDPAAPAPTATFDADEFGNPQQPSGRRYGWLGGKQRRTQQPSGVIQMGVRSYIPAMGRFTTVDPVVGGSANAYDYGLQDPVNQLDLDGRVVGCNVRVTRFTSRHRHLRYEGRWNCPKSAWPGPVTILKVTFRIEKEVRGFFNILLQGHWAGFYGPFRFDPRPNQYRYFGFADGPIECKRDWKYKVTVTVHAILHSPTGIGGGTKQVTERHSREVRCR